MVLGAMHQLTESDLGSTAFLVLDSGPLPQGTLLLEMIFVVNSMAPKELEVRRYLPPTGIRLLLDAQGKDYAALLPFEHIRGKSLHRERQMASQVIKSQAPLLRNLLQQGEALANERAQNIIDSALQQMRHELHEEHERLQALTQSAAGEEAQMLLERRDLLEEQLPRTRLRLDAMRLMIRT